MAANVPGWYGVLTVGKAGVTIRGLSAPETILSGSPFKNNPK